MNRTAFFRQGRRRKSGFSLLEVILAIAILGGSIVVIGELVRLGSRSAEAARESTTAQMLCESKLAEIAAGIVPAQPQAKVPFEEFPDWFYSIETEQGPQENLLAVRVTVQPDQPARLRPISFSLTRWMVDPTIEMQLTEEAAQSQQSTSSTSTSTSKSGSSSSGGAGK